MRNENNWIFTKDEIDNSPSTVTMTVSKEREMRKVACKFVQNVARAPRINLSRSTVITAQILLHRYFMRRTFQDNPWDVSIGALFLASKIVSEYSSRISRYLIHECARNAKKIHDPKYELNPNEKEYGYWKNNMHYYEMEILRVLCYDMTFEEPYSYCSLMSKELNISKEVKSVACYLLDESFVRTTLCLQYEAKVIAAGALLLSILQNDQAEVLQAISLFKEKDIPIKNIKAVANEMQSMIIKMDENLSPVHSQNETKKQNTHISCGNGYSKMYSPPARTYIKSPLSQDSTDNSKQQQKNTYHSSIIKSSNNVYSSPMASPVSLTDLPVVDHTNSNEKSYVNLSTNEFVSTNYKNKGSNCKNFLSYNNNLLQGRNKQDKFRQKKQEKLRQKNIYYNNSNRITKYHVPHYTKINTNTNKVYL